MAERRARILEAAGALIETGDVAALTMRALSENAEVSVPTIYNLIGGRDDVLAAVMDLIGVTVDAELSILDSPPLERCFDIADHCVARVTSRVDITQSVLAEGLGPVMIRGEGAPLRRYGPAIGRALVEAAERDEIILISSVRLLAENMMSLVAMRLARWAASDPNPPAAQLHAEAAHAVGLTLAAVVTEPFRPLVLQRMADARATLEHQRPDLERTP